MLLAAGVPLRPAGPTTGTTLVSASATASPRCPALGVPVPRRRRVGPRSSLLAGGGALLALAAAARVCARRRGRRGRRRRGRARRRSTPSRRRARADHPFVDGTVFALLLARVAVGRAARAPRGAAAPRRCVVAAAIARRRSSRRAWTRPSRGSTTRRSPSRSGARGRPRFNWNHSYGPLDWPRDGREVLRIARAATAYWKADEPRRLRRRALARRPAACAPTATTPQRRVRPPGWVADASRVAITTCARQQFVTARATTLRSSARRARVDRGAPGTFITGDAAAAPRRHLPRAASTSPSPSDGELRPRRAPSTRGSRVPVDAAAGDSGSPADARGCGADVDGPRSRRTAATPPSRARGV